jgi:hypothetical protein
MQVEPRNYASYMLRLQQVEQAGQLVWRATLESIQTGERECFVDVQTLADFLLERFGTVTIGIATPGDDNKSSG